MQSGRYPGSRGNGPGRDPAMPYYIEKTRVQVHISEPGREPMKGVLSLSPRAALHSGHETVLDLLNAPQRVIPAARLQGGTVLFTRLQIAWVLAANDVSHDLV